MIHADRLAHTLVQIAATRSRLGHSLR